MFGLRISARSQVTLWAQEGGEEDDVTLFHWGSPERLRKVNLLNSSARDLNMKYYPRSRRRS